MYMCVHVCIYACICINMLLYACICVCMRVYACIPCICVYMRVQDVYMVVYVCICACDVCDDLAENGSTNSVEAPRGKAYNPPLRFN